MKLTCEGILRNDVEWKALTADCCMLTLIRRAQTDNRIVLRSVVLRSVLFCCVLFCSFLFFSVVYRWLDMMCTY